MYTLQELETKIKRRVHQIRSTTDADTESEQGYIFSDSAIRDAINSGRQKIVSTVIDSKLWSSQMAVLTTVSDIQDYSIDIDSTDLSIHAILGVLYDTDSDGKRTSNSVMAHPIDDIAEEEAIINDPMYTPSDTEPFYRIINRGIRLITSEDGSQTASKYIRIEFEGDMADLVNDVDNSYLSHELDMISIEWALKILLEKTNPQASARFESSFYNSIKLINARSSNAV